MQAVILAAGLGRRLGRLTKDLAKCMIAVNGRPLIEQSLECLAKLNLSRIVIVVGHGGEGIISTLGTSYGGIPLVYVWNHDYAKTNNIYSLFLAEEYLCEDDTILLESDLIYDAAILQKLVADERPDLAVVSKYESWMDGTVVKLDADDNITSFIPKKFFSYLQISEYYKTVNIYKFSKGFLRDTYIPFLRAYSSAVGKNEYYEQVLRVILTLERHELKGFRVNGERWYEIDDIQDIDNAETIFRAPEARYEAMVSRWGGYWRFPGIKDYCLLVNPYFPPEVMLEEIKAYFGSLVSSYPSGRDVLRMLAGKMFGCPKEYVLVGNGASELIAVLSESLKGKVGYVYPTFEEYPNRFGSKSSSERLLPLESTQSLSYSREDLEVLSRNVDVVILVNPDNPSGQYMEKANVLALAEDLHRKGKYLVVDESFLDFSNEGCEGSLIRPEVLSEFSSLIVIRSISKSYGVPGFRLGVLATGNQGILELVGGKLPIWNIGSFAEFFLQIIGKYEQQYIDSCVRVRSARDELFAKLKSFPFLHPVPSNANFILCELSELGSARDFCVTLLDRHGVLVKDCSGKSGLMGRQYVRIAVKSKEDNDYLCECIEAYWLQASVSI